MNEPSVDILVVDDNPVKLLALEAALAPLGARLHKAASGREALRLLLEREFAVILLDVSMPTMDGFETAELIRARERSAHTPIIFITAISQSEAHATRGYRLGAVDYVFAPVHPDVLRAKVAVFVELHRRAHEARRQAERIAADALELAASNERLRHAERLASLGSLAAGLGHDLSNLLLPVRFHLESIRAEAVPPAVLEDVAAVARCTEYLQRLAYGLRMLALDGEDENASTVETDIRTWWTGFSPVLRGCLPRGAVLETRMDGSLPSRVRIPEHHLSQVVFNLVQNAGDALRNRDSGHVVVWAGAEGDDAARLVISDDGPGMPDDVKKRCFEPFFTTKTRGMSTGLGLSLVRTLITRAGGSVGVESQVGAGTTFTLMLPCARQGSADHRQNSAAKPLALVSVAEPRTAGFIGAVLSSLGYEPYVGSGAVARDARLWVLECQQAHAEAVKAFCDGDPGRRVVVLGESKGLAESAQVAATGEKPTPGAVRQALRRAAEACRPKTEGHRDASPDPSAVRGRQRTDRRGHQAKVEAGARP